jgi:hypothetical protein
MQKNGTVGIASPLLAIKQSKKPGHKSAEATEGHFFFSILARKQRSYVQAPKPKPTTAL